MLKHAFICGLLITCTDGAAQDKHPLVVGKHQQALDLRVSAAGLLETDELGRLPLTLDGWVKLDSKRGFNILVASEPKASASHWELYTYVGSGELSLYMPGIAKSEIRSSRDICDGQWHYIGLQLTTDRVRLFVDGEAVADQRIDEPPSAEEATALAIGRLVEGSLGCDGVIDSLRIRRGVHEVTRPSGQSPAADTATLALWTFDQVSPSGGLPDLSPHGRELMLIPAAAVVQAPLNTASQTEANQEKITGHWGEDTIGFRWTEEDSVDGRWQEMDKGPFLATTIQVETQSVLKGLVIKLGDQQGAVCYDTANMTCEFAWQGKFIQTFPERYGLIRHPTAGGPLTWDHQGSASWGQSRVHYQGLYLAGQRCLLQYSVDDVDVLESPQGLPAAGNGSLVRTLQIAPHTQPLALSLGTAGPDELRQTRRHSWNIVLGGNMPPGSAVAYRWSQGGQPPELRAAPRADEAGAKAAQLWLPAEAQTRQLQIVIGQQEALLNGEALQEVVAPDMEQLKQPGKALWEHKLTTRGLSGEPANGLRMDTIDVPLENPYRALMFLSGIDFFSNGAAAISTVHGDVWLVQGLQGALAEVRWQRFATGLFQPLGVKIVDDQVFVLGKDQITRLEDRDGNGEADRYVNFNNDGDTSVGNHDYAACLETDQAGNFYYVRGNTGVERVSPDGSRHDVIATGLRNPNGMGIGPGDLITVSPQEGEWTPASNIAVIREGGHYGYRGPQVTAERPLGYDPPMIWFPRLLDNSSGGQVWLPDEGWGPLGGAMIHLSFGRCWPLLVLPQQVAGQWQAGAIKLPFECRSGICRGRIQPGTQHLYVTGLKGWASASIDDGCLIRLVPVDEKMGLPIKQRVVSNGIVLTFGEPLDEETVQDSSHWSAQQWNYRYAADYGSADYKLSSPGQQGHDEVEIVSTTLLSDRCSVFLEIPAIRPVMQMAVTYRIKSERAQTLNDTLYLTVHGMEQESLEPGPHAALAAQARASQPARETLHPGVLVRFSQQSIGGPIVQDVRVDRMVSLDFETGFLTPLIESRALHAVFEGWLYLEQREVVEFRALAEGVLAMKVGDQWLKASTEHPLETRWTDVTLEKGLNAIQLVWDTAEEPTGGLRLLWSGENFESEPVPSARWYHDPEDGRLVRTQQLRHARVDFAELNCHRCHALPASITQSPGRMPEFDFEPPSLVEAGDRYQARWLYDWILAPRELDATSEMPHLFDPQDASDRQRVADIVAYLQSLSAPTAADGRPIQQGTAVSEEEAEAGLFRFEELGCVACHRIQIDDAGRKRISLDGVGRKFTAESLGEFLQDPTRYYPAHRMPVFRVDDAARKQLVAFLMSSAAPVASSEVPSGDRVAGAQAFQDSGCANCHRVAADTGLLPPVRSLPKPGQLDGCLADAAAASPAAPDFGLEPVRRARLRELLSGQVETLAADSQVEVAERWVQRLRCTACHQRDGVGADLAEILFDESVQGLSPERLPDLTWSGEKFQPDWLAGFLADSSREPLRPWLLARMPAFPAYAEGLAQGLVRQHGLSMAGGSFRAGPMDLPDAAQQVGAQLIGQVRGFDCRQCHALGDLPATGDQKTQVALGVNFVDAARRLNYGYYRRWMIDPLRIDPLTKMPRYSEDRETTKIEDVLAGNAHQQFDAIWAYLRQLDKRIQSGSP